MYAGWLAGLESDGQEEERWPAAISVGTNPTFDGRERTVEAYALDRDDLDLYGVHVAVDFAARLRGMVRFGSADALVEQMRRDAAKPANWSVAPSHWCARWPRHDSDQRAPGRSTVRSRVVLPGRARVSATKLPVPSFLPARWRA